MSVEAALRALLVGLLIGGVGGPAHAQAGPKANLFRGPTTWPAATLPPPPTVLKLTAAERADWHCLMTPGLLSLLESAPQRRPYGDYRLGLYHLGRRCSGHDFAKAEAYLLRPAKAGLHDAAWALSAAYARPGADHDRAAALWWAHLPGKPTESRPESRS